MLKFLNDLEGGFAAFLTGLGDDTTKKNICFQKALTNYCLRKRATVKVLEMHDKWFGVTYKEDKAEVVAAIRK